MVDLEGMDNIFFLYRGEQYFGYVVGCEKNYFWLLVPSLKALYVGHPNRVFENQGKKYFEIFDHRESTEKMFDKSGEPQAWTLQYAENPGPIVDYLRAFRTIRAV